MENFLHFEYLSVIATTFPGLLKADTACPFISRKTWKKFLPVTYPAAEPALYS